MTAFPKSAPIRLKGAAMEALRREVFERDGYRCQHMIAFAVSWNLGKLYKKCLKSVTWESGHLAHIKSRGAGGGDTAENCVTKCPSCHIGREHTKGER